MIDIESFGAGSVKLRGDNLRQHSTIFLHHKSGWHLTLYPNRYHLYRREGLTREQVIPAIKEILEETHIEEDIHEPEINFYLDIIQKDFGPGGKYNHG